MTFFYHSRARLFSDGITGTGTIPGKEAPGHFAFLPGAGNVFDSLEKSKKSAGKNTI
jgi:hypothetical protein